MTDEWIQVSITEGRKRWSLVLYHLDPHPQGHSELGYPTGKRRKRECGIPGRFSEPGGDVAYMMSPTFCWPELSHVASSQDRGGREI